jgi:hypothetical protein
MRGNVRKQFLVITLACMAVGFSARSANAGTMAYTSAINHPFSYFAMKGNVGLSGAAGGSFSYGGSLGWMTNGLAVWVSGNGFTFGDAFDAGGYLTGGEVEVDADLDFETDYYRNNRYIGSRVGAIYFPLVIGGYGQEITTKNVLSFPLQPAFGCGMGIRGTGASFGKGGFFYDLNCIYRYAPLDTDPGVVVIHTVTGLTGSVAIGLWFE